MLSFNPQSAGRSGNNVPSPQREFILLGSGILTRPGGSSADICFAAEGVITGLEVAANKLGKKLKMKRVPRSMLSIPMAARWQPLPHRLSAHRCRGIPPKTNLIPRSGRAGTGRAWLQAVPLSAKISRTSAPKGRYLGRVRNPASFHNRFHRQVRPQTLPGSRYPN
jgi:hypothetical protein